MPPNMEFEMFRRLLAACRHRTTLAGLALLGGLLAGLAVLPAAAQVGAFTPAQRTEIVQIVRQALRQDPTILRDAISALQDDEARRKETATERSIGALQTALIGNPVDPEMGNPKGDVTVVEFYDVRCPYCRRMVPVMAELLKADPRIRLVYKDIPILGPGSVLGAKALLAAQNQGGYAKLHALLMTGNPNIDLDRIKSASEHAGLDWARLQRDMNSAEVAARIKANLSLAHQLSINGTPAYVIGRQLLPGAVELSELQDAVAAARQK
jgi:protein-disulfide isomerase